MKYFGLLSCLVPAMLAAWWWPRIAGFGVYSHAGQAYANAAYVAGTSIPVIAFCLFLLGIARFGRAPATPEYEIRIDRTAFVALVHGRRLVCGGAGQPRVSVGFEGISHVVMVEEIVWAEVAAADKRLHQSPLLSGGGTDADGDQETETGTETKSAAQAGGGQAEGKRQTGEPPVSPLPTPHSRP